MKKLRKSFSALFAAALTITLAFVFTACGKATDANSSGEDIYSQYPDAHIIKLNGDSASMDGNSIKEFDYSWSISPDDPDERYSGTAPDENLGVYIAHDIIYYPEIPESEFVKADYDGEEEWVTKYTAAGMEDYIFATLPVLGTELPKEMMHTPEEAYQNPVLHITEPGEYVIEGNFSGQLLFDLGEKDDTFSDEEAKIVVILNGVNVECSVAPAVIFRDIYECDNGWEERDSHTGVTDLSSAGVKIVIADGTENDFSGGNVFRLLKPEYKSGSTSVQKKRWKMDGAFYSFQSIEINGGINGTGILNITSTTYEGLDSELHMTINGGYVNIFSQDDGINVNEDNVSVFTMNGGHLTIFASLGAEGDVIDSNGFIRVNGGTIAGTSKSPSDELLDSENGTEISEEAVIIYGGSMSQNNGIGMPGDMPNRDPGMNMWDRPGSTPAEMPEPPEGFPFGDENGPPDRFEMQVN